MTVRIVFDLDGTLIDSAPDICGIANKVLAGAGAEPITLHQTHQFIGEGVNAFVTKMRAARGIPDTNHQQLLDEMVGLYDDAVSLTELYPGVADALKTLAAQHNMGICTNKPRRPCLSVLKHLGIDGYFDTVWGGDNDLGRKPDPAPLLAAFKALGNGPSIYVGDSEVDAETAQRAGVPFLLFTEGYRKTAVAEIPHDHAFDSFERLPDFIAAYDSG